MGKHYQITEEQQRFLKENGILTVNADVAASGGNVTQAIENTKKTIRQNGVNPENVKIQVDATESKTIKVGDIRNERYKSLMEHARNYSVKDFLNKR